MAEVKEDILLNLVLNTADSVKSIERLRAETRLLTQERNKTDASTAEGQKRIEQLNVSIDKNNTFIKTNSAALEKQRLNVGNYTESIVEASKQIKQLEQENNKLNQALKNVDQSTEEGKKEYENLNIAIQNNITQINVYNDQLKKTGSQADNVGSSLKQLVPGLDNVTGSLAKFATPAGAAVGILTALGAAYARSSIGAKDLEFAQNQLSSITNILTDRFAALFSTAEDGEGFFSGLLNNVLELIQYIPIVALYSKALGIDLGEIAEQSRLAALASDKLNGIFEDRETILAKNNERLAENSELLTTLTDTTLTFTEREEAKNKIVANSIINAKSIISSLEEERKQIMLKNVGIKDEGPLKLELGKIDRQIASARLFATREQEKAQKALNAAEKQAAASVAANLKAEIADRIRVNKEVDDYIQKLRASYINIDQQTEARLQREQAAAELSQKFFNDTGNVQFGAFQRANERIKKGFVETEQFKRDQVEETAEFQEERLRNQIDALATFTGLAAGIFSENTIAYKLLATTDAIVNTYKGANLALGSLPPPLSFLAAGATITAGLANVAKINGAGFAEGGFTGEGTKHEVAGVVHKGEWVAPKEMVQSPSFRPIIQQLEVNRRGLKGYSDGGLVTNTATAPMNTSLMITNAIRRIPAPVVGVKQIAKVQREVQVKQNISRL